MKKRLGLSLDISSSPQKNDDEEVHRHKGHKLLNLAIRNVSTKKSTKTTEKSKKSKFALDELDFEEINRTSSLNRSKSTPEGPTCR